MITFISFFLSLVVGPQIVEMDVAPSVARVELLLDGEIVASLYSVPWRTQIELGTQLKPHHLEAVSFDSQGLEIERVDQWINLPRPRTELKLVLETENSPPREARLVWQSLDAQQFNRIRVTLDGMPLTFDASGRIPLPPLDSSGRHLLQVEIAIESKILRTETLIGTRSADSISSGLTAIPVVWKKRQLPSVENLDNSFSRSGQRLKVATVEKAPSDILIVQDQSPEAHKKLTRLRAGVAKSKKWHGLRPNDRLIAIFPQIDESPSTVNVNFFPATLNITTDETSSYKYGVFNSIPSTLMDADPAHQRLSDAVAVSGLRAAAGSRPRVVLLILAGKGHDQSQHSVESVLHYLDLLRVPLVVWSVDRKRDKTGPWPEVKDIGKSQYLMREIRELRSLLDSQIIVWVEGIHPLHEIELTKDAPSGMDLVGSK